MKLLISSTRRLGTATASALLVLPLASCGGGGDTSDAPNKDGQSAVAEESGSWTLLFYSVADNSLESPMAADVNEVGDVGSSDQLHLREYMDRAGAVPDEVLDQGAWEGARIFDVNDDGTTTDVDDLGVVNSADPALLAQVMGQAFTDLPADHYGLIISDHGGQWTGVGVDDSEQAATGASALLGVGDLVTGISAGLEAAGLDKLDLLGFDACMMAGYEVASAMAPLADRMVASQETEPGQGWDYHSLDVASDGATADEIGTAIIDGFEAQADDPTVTLALLDLTQMDPLDQAVADFGTALGEQPAALPAVGRAQSEVQGFGRDPDPSSDSHLSDLGSLADSVAAASPDVADPATAVSDAVDAVVVDQFDGDAVHNPSGLSIYLPPTPDLVDPAYADVASAGSWSDFLGTYYDGGEAIPDAEYPTFAVDEPDYEFDDAGINLSAAYDPVSSGNLTEAKISYALTEDDGTVTYLGEESADLGAADDPIVQGSYDFTYLEMSDGEDSTPPTPTSRSTLTEAS